MDRQTTTFSVMKLADMPRQIHPLSGLMSCPLLHSNEGYAAVAQANGMTHQGCRTHARRKFDEAIKG
jgi:hypothetical protein